MRAVDNTGTRLLIELGLGSQLAAIVFQDVCIGGVIGELGDVSLGCTSQPHNQLLKNGRGQNLQSGGRSRAFATSTLFTTFVLIPFPLPSICESTNGSYIGGPLGRLQLSAAGHTAGSHRARQRVHRTYPGLQLGHLVPIEGITSIRFSNVDCHICRCVSSCCGRWCWLPCR